RGRGPATLPPVLRARRTARAAAPASPATAGLAFRTAEQPRDGIADLSANEVPDHGDEALLSRHRSPPTGGEWLFPIPSGFAWQDIFRLSEGLSGQREGSDFREFTFASTLPEPQYGLEFPHDPSRYAINILMQRGKRLRTNGLGMSFLALRQSFDAHSRGKRLHECTANVARELARVHPDAYLESRGLDLT